MTEAINIQNLLKATATRVKELEPKSKLWHRDLLNAAKRAKEQEELIGELVECLRKEAKVAGCHAALIEGRGYEMILAEDQIEQWRYAQTRMSKTLEKARKMGVER